MERIGEYEVRRLIGEGGMGKVYEAEERLSGRRVALKVMRAELARSEDARRLFRSEMQILARLEHPHIVRSLTSFEADGQLVLALEYLRGRTLRDALVARGKLVWQEAVEIGAQICEALVAAHGCEPSVVHRDLKPENVMLVPPAASDTGPGADGTNLGGTEEVKVMDFGIAKVLEAARATNTPSVGTLEYMSPEQIDARPIDGRSDLYALGLVMYEMLAGHVPFRSASPRELLNLQCTADVPDLPEETRQGLPAGVEELIFDLLEKNPDDRPADARVVLDRLTALRPTRRASRRRSAERESAGETAPSAEPARSRTGTTRGTTRTRSPGRLDTVALLEQDAAPREISRLLSLALVIGLSLAAGATTYGVRWREAARDEAPAKAATTSAAGRVEHPGHGALSDAPQGRRPRPRRTAGGERRGPVPRRPRTPARGAGEGAWCAGAARAGHRVLVDLAPDVADEALVTFVGGVDAAVLETRLDWTPTAQLAGAAWDVAADRFVAGLIAYRVISGGHPARDEARVRLDPRWSAPPFPGELARVLELGVQTLVLAMLDPEPSRRPQSAREIRRRAASLEATRARRSAAPSRARGDLGGATWTVPRSAPTGWSLVVLAMLSAVAALLAPVFGRETSRAEATKPVVGAARPVADMTPESCGSCHPRELAEWSRSAMAFAAQSPLFGALESAVEEQVQRSDDCPGGGGVLRGRADRARTCTDRRSGEAVTGSGGEGWCTRCHLPEDGRTAGRAALPPWSAVDARSRRPVRDLAPEATRAGIGCVVCHAALAPGHDLGARSAGNPGWTSFVTGARFTSRPEDERGLLGIANSGYRFDRDRFLATDLAADGTPHDRADDETRRYLRSSESCGSCHDVRLFGTDVLGGRERGEHFKRLRNVYSEWRAWADDERSAGRTPSTCQDCHMSLYPGVCVAGVGGARADGDGASTGCPGGTHFEARPPGAYPQGRIALSSPSDSPVLFHGFTSVDVPLSPGFTEAWTTDPSLDVNGIPRGLAARRAQLLRHTFAFSLDGTRRDHGQLIVPVQLTNRGAGHRVPAGFSQERETWVELEVRDARGALVYQVGHLDRPSENLHDKVFERVRTTAPDSPRGDVSSVGVFGADVRDGPDVPRWTEEPAESAAGGPVFRGLGLINLQNGFLRCVRCIGFVDARGVCQAGRAQGQGALRADRFADGAYDLDTGECRSNLTGRNALFETYFPVGALDADRGAVKAPDAIVDTRSAAPGVTTTYRYEIPLRAGGVGSVARGSLQVRAVLHFRPFPPFLLDAFVRYEAEQARLGRRPSGPQITADALRRLDVVDLAEVRVSVP